MEIIMVAVITFLGVAIIVFYSTGKSDNRRKTQNLEYLFDNSLVFGLICVLPALLAVAFVLYFRNRNYIVGYLFDDHSNQLIISYRGILNKTTKDISLPYNKVVLKEFNEKKILFNQTYKGKSIMRVGHHLKLDFVTNNFIWEEQPREKIHFLEEIHRINNTHNSK